MDNPEKLNVQLKGTVADKFKRIKTYLGLENDTEVVRSLITWYYNEHNKDLAGPPRTMWHLNLSENSVLIWDPDIHKAVDVYFTDHEVKCGYCESRSCKHVQFALAQKDVKEAIEKHVNSRER